VVEAVHSKEYLTTLHSSPVRVAKVVELPPLAVLPMCLLDRMLLKKLRIQAGGTVLAAALAIMEGWSINIGGGMHHASWNNGEGNSLPAPSFVCSGHM
jgi:histone deacetylase 11